LENERQMAERAAKTRSEEELRQREIQSSKESLQSNNEPQGTICV
jgi:hypothetical protein